MFISQLLRVRFVAAIALALVLATAAYGFAASNTVPATKAGDGTGAVSGYTVSDITYVLESDASKVDTVTFTLDAAATEVQVKVGGTWYTADNGGSGNVWTIDPSAGALSVASVSSLQIVAHS